MNDILYVSRAKAASIQSPVTFDAVQFEAESDDAGRLLSSLQPDVVVNCASYYSPWENIHQPSLWTQLLRSAGFGFTLPLQSAFAIKFAKAVAEHSQPVLFINGCYPDAVNPLLRALDLPIFCGIGNIALLAATLRSSLDLKPEQRLQVMAHHLHLYTPKPGVDEAQVWIDGKPCENVSSLLAGQRASTGLEVNKVIGCTGAVLLRDIVDERNVETHAPGPFGLPGGYPVRVAGTHMELNLPPGLSEAKAILWNEKIAVADGVRILPDGYVEFGEKPKHAFKQYLPQVADGFHASEIEKVAQSMLKLRAKLTMKKAQSLVPDDQKVEAS
ncbi:MAG TPA: potassium transporter TrkA [Candidatus Angelobacter sp.]|nr:potassium transporter TrkA [Candidatus Angelobacter sp.]